MAWASVFVRPAPAVQTGLANKSDFNVDWALNSIFAWALVICVLVISSSHTITLLDDEGKTFKVNGHRLKIFLEPDNKEYDVINFIEET